jgi:hypothetical protein
MVVSMTQSHIFKKQLIWEICLLVLNLLYCVSIKNYLIASAKKQSNCSKEGIELGCQDCQGMLGYCHSLTYDFDLAYQHSVESADTGNIFGKFALAKLLHTLSSYIPDEYEETFYIFSDDNFISNFMRRNIANVDDVDDSDDTDNDYDSALSDFYNDPNVLNSYDQRRIAGVLFDDIREEYEKNPSCPKVWVSLPGP